MISVVIPAYNEEERLGECLRALVQQTIRKQMEVIVVDNASTDHTAAVALSFKKKLNIRVVHEPRRLRGAAREHGSRTATGDILFGIDADTVPPPQWAEHMLRIFQEQPDVVGVVGTTWINDCPSVTNRIHNALWPFTLHMFRLVHGYYSLSGHNFAVRRKAYDQAGGFDPDFDALEDVDLSARIAPLGRIVLTKQFPVKISGRRFRRGFFLGWFEYIWSYVVIKMFQKKTVVLAKAE